MEVISHMAESSIDTLRVNETQAIEIDGFPVLVCNSGGRHYAVENRCSHQDNPLTGGRIRNGHICCPLHGVRFDLITGEPKGQLTRIPLRTFEVKESNDKVLIKV